MAKNRVIVTAGKAIKKEKILLGTHSNPGEIMMNVVDDAQIKVQNATTNVRPMPLQIVDYGSTNGMAGPLNAQHTEYVGDVYQAGDQIPLLTPYSGSIVNILGAVNTAYNMGDLVTPNGIGQMIVTADPAEAFGMVMEDVPAQAINQYVLVEVF